MTLSDYPIEKLDKLSNEVLTSIEEEELRLLNWGFVDVKNNLDHALPKLLEKLSTPVGKTLWAEAQQFGVIYTDILENLLLRKLVFEVGEKQFYRSRFAETIRLLALLRQRFSDEDWQTALRLVTDSKISIKRRYYPQRNIIAEDIRQELRQLGAKHIFIEAISLLLQKGKGTEEIQLARFQKDAIIQHSKNLLSYQIDSDQSDHAVVIGAGTGAGKTKAFYIPALAEIAEHITQTRYVQAIAIYPRIELLKDQLSEAFFESRKLDTFLQERKPHVITMGAYYSDTPGSAKLILETGKGNQSKWNKITLEGGQEGWICPYFSCPSPQHKPQNLMWYEEDVKKEADLNAQQKRFGEFERLRCPQCNFTIEGNLIFLTRDHISREAPDIFFTTTEMLNRRFGRVNDHKLFGIDIKNTPPPRMLLLDEIHTYEGIHGAHIAYLLRRWRHARRLQQAKGLYCVGLSATLSDAITFFHKLTGINQNQVDYIYPDENDMEIEGAEYNIVLKGDPASTTNLLSTSVQTAMLLARMLDISPTQPSRGAYGQKIFAFTDKLDVTNRWYQIEHDAEINQTLSKFRERKRQDTIDIQLKKFLAGQDWQFANDIGHKLAKPLQIDITSSQNRGVDAKANLIIATSTLEVGFNDPTVGAVIQHKAPQSMASFLQRKGRAGRSRKMRPWMIVITSAYGRDRWAFQHSENLFNPTLNQINLPIENFYVRKIQAVFALMDWLALRLKDEKECHFLDIWNLLAGYQTTNDDSNRKFGIQRNLVIQMLEDVMFGIRRNDLSSYLKQALQLDQKGVNSLLWDEPRSLFFEVIPTMLRQLKTNWQKFDIKGEIKEHADIFANYPLPDFVTPSLFAELKSFNIPIHIPPDPIQKNPLKKKGKLTEVAYKERDEALLPLLQSLTEFAPGNVSRRYTSKEDHKGSHWLPIPTGDHLDKGVLSISEFKNSIVFDDVPQSFTIDGDLFYLYRPRSYALERIPEKVKNSSSSRLVWHSHFTGKAFRYGTDLTSSTSAAEILPLATHSSWSKLFTEIRSYTLAKGSWIQVARLATEVRAETRYEGQAQSKRQWLKFKTDDDRSAGIGFVSYVDGIEFQFQPLNVEDYKKNNDWAIRYKTLRPEYFLYRLQHHPNILAEKLSRFEIEWLWQLELSMLVATAVGQNCYLEQASFIVNHQRLSIADRAMKVIFQSQQAEENGEEKVGRLHEKLRGLLGKPNIIQALENAQKVLWAQNNEQLDEWLHQCYASSLGATLFASLTQLIPDIDPDDLVMDIEDTSIWITEKTPGGIGLISKIAHILKTHPYAFDMQMRDILYHCERQHLAIQLHMIANYLGQENTSLQKTFAHIRAATQIDQQEGALTELKSTLEELGVSATRELIVSLQSKFLRPSSDSDTDDLVTQLVQFWQNEEERLNCAIDLRVIAVAALKDKHIEQKIQQILRRISGSSETEESQIFNILQSLLWLPCVDSCPDCIETAHPYQELVKPSRAILLSLLKTEEQDITYGQTNWLEQAKAQLSTTYSSRITCQQDQISQCQQHLFQMLIEPIEIGYQFFFPMVERITRSGRYWTIEMKIREFAHA